MILYHGTNVDFSEVDFAKSNKNKDFGCGFYLTDIFEQAQHWAIKKSELFSQLFDTLFYICFTKSNTKYHGNNYRLCNPSALEERGWHEPHKASCHSQAEIQVHQDQYQRDCRRLHKVG